QDPAGTTDPTCTGGITVALGTNPSGGTLSGTTTVSAVAGVASFATLAIDKVGTGYTLTAGGGSLTGGPSTAFDVTAGAATHLAFTVQPTSTTAGSVVTPAVRVTALDGQGNIATAFPANVTLALRPHPAGAPLSGPGPHGAGLHGNGAGGLGKKGGGGSLGGTTSVAATAGVATFANLSINRSGTGYTLTGTATGLTTAGSTSFDITPGAAAQVVFTVQPTTTTAGATIAPAVQVTAQDAQGNTATGFSGNITVALGANPGGGTLSGTTAIAATAGVASFANLSINRTGTAYTLVAAATGVSGGTSAAFNVTPGA